MPIAPEQFWNYTGMRTEAQRLDRYDWEYVSIPIEGMADRFVARCRGSFHSIVDTACSDLHMIILNSGGTMRHIDPTDPHLSAPQKAAMNHILATLDTDHVLDTTAWPAHRLYSEYGFGMGLCIAPFLMGGYRMDGQRVEVRSSRHFAIKLDPMGREVVIYPPGMGGYSENQDSPGYVREVGEGIRLRLSSAVYHKGRAVRVKDLKPIEIVKWFPGVWNLGVSLQERIAREAEEKMALAATTEVAAPPNETEQQRMMRLYREQWANLNRSTGSVPGTSAQFLPIESLIGVDDNEYVVNHQPEPVEARPPTSEALRRASLRLREMQERQNIFATVGTTENPFREANTVDPNRWVITDDLNISYEMEPQDEPEVF